MDQTHNQYLGKTGEEMAIAWFRQRGYTIVATNWRSGRSEIDLIASMENRLHFIEVKTRLHGSMARPEESIGKTKKNQLRQGAEAYLYQYPQWKEIQFDVLAIEMDDGGATLFTLFPNIM